jgi:hypothetical protein
MLNATPASNSPATQMSTVLPPRPKVRVVAALSAMPGKMKPSIGNVANNSPHGRHNRAKPVMAVSPVARV